MQIETLNNNGNYVRVDLFPANGVFPRYVLGYLADFNRGLEGSNLEVVKLKRNLLPEGCYFSLWLTLDVSIASADFELYMNQFLDSDLLPFFHVTRMNPRTVTYEYFIPQPFQKLATGGELDVVLHAKDIPPYLERVLLEVFDIDEEGIDNLESTIQLISQCRLEKRVQKKDVMKFEYIMNKFGIEYELE